MAKFCKNCGSPIEEGAPFCESCGTALAVDQPQEPEQALEPPGDQYMSPPPPPAPPQEQYTPPQGQYAPPPQGQYGAPPKKKLSKKLLILIIIAAFIVVAFVAGKLATGNIAGNDFFKLGDDQIPTVKYVLGEERKITSYSTSKSGGIQETVVKYSVSENQGDEMLEYCKALMDKYGFYNTTPYDFSGAKGSGFEFMAESVEEGYLLVATVDYDKNGYVLTYKRGKGELTVYDDPPEEPKDDDPGDQEPTDDSGDMVEIAYAGIYFEGYSEEEIIAAARESGYDAKKNPDGNYTLKMTKEQQQEFLEETRQDVEVTTEALLGHMSDQIDRVECSDDLSKITMFINGDILNDNDGHLLFHAVSLAFSAAPYQEILGRGPGAPSALSIVDANDPNEVYMTITAPTEAWQLYVDNYDKWKDFN